MIVAVGEWSGSGTGSGSDGTEGRKKKKRSRWNTEIDEKTVIPGMPTTIPPNLSKDQEQQYIGKHITYKHITYTVKKCL